MLKPIKNFLTYLQRNANSSNIFGLTTAMGPTEQPRLEETMMIANEDLANEGGDPLYDPLALDDDCPSGSGTVAAVGGIGLHDVSISSEEDVQEEDGGVANGQIILVDVTTLKSSVLDTSTTSVLETDDDDEEDDELGDRVLTTSAEVVVMSDEDVLHSSSSDVVILNSSCKTIEESDQHESDQTNEKLNVSAECGENGDQVIEVESSETTLEGEDCASAPAKDSFTIVKVAETTVASEPLPLHTKEKVVLANGHHHAVVDDTNAAAVVPVSPSTAGEPKPVTATSEQIQGVPAANTTTEPEEEEASDGSDSGLGLEPSRNIVETAAEAATPLELPPIKSSLKRRSEPPAAAAAAAESGGALARDDGVSNQKRPKKGISFEGVTVYYFPRIQGFGCVPSQGGCTLGMEFRHVHSRRLTLAEHSSEQRKVHRQQLQELNPRSSSSDDTSSEEEPSESASEAESESYGFLQPVTTRQRRALLKAAGVRKIDSTEKDECREIRTSREVCGCTCRSFCDPATCACSLAGIKCQVDRPNFPCGCTQDGCANKAGRVEFNPGRVRTHFIHTIMRLEGEANDPVRRPGLVVANGSSSSVGGNSTTVGTIAMADGSSGYVAGSEKNWSNGPIRLPPGMMYGTPPGPSGLLSDGLVPMSHHSQSIPSSYHQTQQHQSPNGGATLQVQHQYFGHLPAPTHLQLSQDSYVASSAYHNYLASEQMLLAAAQPSTSSTTHATSALAQQHHIGGLIRSAHTTDITTTTSTAGVDVQQHYAYNHREYFAGASTTTAAEQMYYNFAAVGAAVGNTVDGESSQTHFPPHLQRTIPLSMHHQMPAGGISTYHHTLPTGHDRQPPVAGYVEPSSAIVQYHSGQQGETNRVEGTVQSAKTSCLPPVQSNTHNNVLTVESSSEETLSQSDTRAVASADSDLNRILPAPEERTVRGEGTEEQILMEINLDDSVEELVEVECESVSPEQTSPEKERTSPRKRPAASSSSFIDLTAPHAGNAERLEAINDMLASSRRSAILARHSVAAEDDVELRDFRHSPVLRVADEEPPAKVVLNDKDVVNVDGGGEDIIVGETDQLPERVNRPTIDSPSPVGKLPALSVAASDNEPISEQTLVQRNGIPVGGGDGGDELEPPEKRFADKTKAVSSGATCSSSDEKLPHVNGTDIGPPTVSPRLPIKQSKTEASTAGLTPLVVVCPVNPTQQQPAAGAPEPSENLCEIIKNSIVETAVSH